MCLVNMNLIIHNLYTDTHFYTTQSSFNYHQVSTCASAEVLHSQDHNVLTSTVKSLNGAVIIAVRTSVSGSETCPSQTWNNFPSFMKCCIVCPKIWP